MNNVKSIQGSIVAILMNNNLDELSLDGIEELADPVYVIWYDNDGTPHEDPVIKVVCKNSKLSFEVEARDFDQIITLYDCDIEDKWLRWIRDNMITVLQNAGKRVCPVCGKLLRRRRRYCSDSCHSLDCPPTIKNVAESANKNIRALVGLVAGKDRKLRKQLNEKYMIRL